MSRASSTSSCPPPSVVVATSAASSAGARSATTEPTREGSGRPPSSIGPAALIAMVPAPTIATTSHASLIGAPGR